MSGNDAPLFGIRAQQFVEEVEGAVVSACFAHLRSQRTVHQVDERQAGGDANMTRSLGHGLQAALHHSPVLEALVPGPALVVPPPDAVPDVLQLVYVLRQRVRAPQA